MKIGILSDTHGLWDPRYARHFSQCQQVWHAGDVGDPAVLDRLRQAVPEVRAVYGNCDGDPVRRHWPGVDTFTVEGVRVLLTHIGGHPGHWAPGIQRLLEQEHAGLMVCGHSHLLKVQWDPALGLLHVNPGAAGRQGWQTARTLVRLHIDAGRIHDLEVIELAKETAS